MDAIDKVISCPIGELPDELLLTIVSHLDIKRGPIADREAEAMRQKENTLTVLGIHALTLTCRKLNAIATSSLYQCIVFSQTPTRLVKLLLRTLIERAELSRHIQYIESPELGLHCLKIRSRECGSLGSLTELDMATYSDHLLRTNWSIDPMDLSLCDYFSKNLYHLSRFCGLLGRLQIAALCLIAIAQNLSQVVISPVWYYASVFACKRYCPSNALQTLWIYAPSRGPLHLRRYDAGSRSTDHQIVTLLDYERRYGQNPSNAYVQMDTFSLHGKHVDEDTLWRVMLPFRTLKHFECRWRNLDSLPSLSGSIASWEPVTSIDLPAYRSVLLALRNSLEVLTLGFTDVTYQVGVDEGIPAFGSFREFASLKDLNVSGLVIFGNCNGPDYPRLSAILPESLETLSIDMKWGSGIEDALINLCSDLSIMPCQLKILECSGGPVPKLIAEKLIAAFSKVGVKLALSIDMTSESVY